MMHHIPTIFPPICLPKIPSKLRAPPLQLSTSDVINMVTLLRGFRSTTRARVEPTQHFADLSGVGATNGFVT